MIFEIMLYFVMFYICILECEDRFMFLSEIYVLCNNKNIVIILGWGGWGYSVYLFDIWFRIKLCGM